MEIMDDEAREANLNKASDDECEKDMGKQDDCLKAFKAFT
jgi:hypothetical protein